MDNFEHHSLTDPFTDAMMVARRELMAWQIMDVIGTDVLTEVTTRNFRVHGEIAPVLAFEALLLPFRRSDGKRATGPRWLTVQITQVTPELFDTHVFGYEAGRYRGHAKNIGVDAEVLGRYVRGLDYSGPEILDPSV